MTFYTVLCYFFLFFMAAVFASGGAMGTTFFLTEIVRKKTMSKPILWISAVAGLLFWYWLLVMQTGVYMGYLRQISGTIGVSFMAFIFAHGVLGAVASIVVTTVAEVKQALKA